ncbi:E3 ubiquitin-protein ligase hrd1 [Tieghemiomyces parasiticus]|uniref:RING-type E3 ubiquitin transferase n=1 Tax=Tieghemiomyces parasiticus TaxID=78921 RepID=A0A9W8AHZ4_9FUNG|nr:E3 ubiquitin-protein ligase hrd1 [Tieghemiomyces parasiticus]
MRLALYGAVTTALTGMVLASAFSQQYYFFAAGVRLSQSNANLFILANMSLFLTLMLGKLVQRTFFGSLRAIEVEHLYEKGWFAVTETCLALTIFKEEFNAQMFGLLLTLMFFKVFHWLVEDRVNYIEQSPTVNWVFHARMLSLITLLTLVDGLFLAYTAHTTLHELNGALSILVVFGFEFAILLTSLQSTIAKYVIYAVEQRRPGHWESKPMYIFAVELVSDLLQLLLYLAFFALITSYHTLPLHIIFNIYATLRSFVNRCRDLVRYRQATRNMNERYPTVTPEELSALSDPTCIICREEMTADPLLRPDPSTQGEVPKQLPCGHIFHFNCLRSWLERQQTCPTCRRTVLDGAPAPRTGNVPPPPPPQPRVRPPPPEATTTDGPHVPTPAQTGTSPPPPPPAGVPPSSGISSAAPPHNGFPAAVASPLLAPRARQANSREATPTASTSIPRGVSQAPSHPWSAASPGSAHPNPAASAPAVSPDGTDPALATLLQQAAHIPSQLQQGFYDPLLYSTAADNVPFLTPLVPVVPSPLEMANHGPFNRTVTSESSLPAALSDAQLRTLASHSQAAVRERLRILHGIHETVWNSISQLNQLLEVDNQLLQATAGFGDGTRPSYEGQRGSSATSPEAPPVDAAGPSTRQSPPQPETLATGGPTSLTSSSSKGKAPSSE